jgi:hypothetical protein
LHPLERVPARAQAVNQVIRDTESDKRVFAEPRVLQRHPEDEEKQQRLNVGSLEYVEQPIVRARARSHGRRAVHVTLCHRRSIPGSPRHGSGGTCKPNGGEPVHFRSPYANQGQRICQETRRAE